MSGPALSQDTYLNAVTPLSVIGSGGGGGSAVTSVTGLAPNIVTATVANAVTVGLTSSIAGISSIAFGGAYGNITGVSTINGIVPAGSSASGSFSTIYMNPTTGNIRNALEILGVSTITGNGLEIDFQNTGPTVEPWGKVEYEDSTMKMTTSINLAGGATSDSGVFAKPSTLSLAATYTDGGASRGTNIDMAPTAINIYGDTADAFNVTLGLGASLSAPALVNVSTINGAAPASLKTLDIAAAGSDYSLPANVRGSVNLQLNTPLTAGHRYVYSPTVYISSSGAGGWPASAAGTCWLSGQTSEILGGPWSYSQLSTAKGGLNVSVIVPTSMFGTAGVTSFSPNFAVSADWPMTSIIAVSSIQTTNPDFYATTLVDLGVVSSGP